MGFSFEVPSVAPPRGAVMTLIKRCAADLAAQDATRRTAEFVRARLRQGALP